MNHASVSVSFSIFHSSILEFLNLSPPLPHTFVTVLGVCPVCCSVPWSVGPKVGTAWCFDSLFSCMCVSHLCAVCLHRILALMLFSTTVSSGRHGRRGNSVAETISANHSRNASRRSLVGHSLLPCLIRFSSCAAARSCCWSAAGSSCRMGLQDLASHER